MSTDDKSATAAAGPVLSEGLGAHEGLASNMRSPGGRPRFTVQDGGRWIDDDDFLYDASLKVSGDFTDEARVAFAQWVCDALNEADKMLPRPPLNEELGPNIKPLDLGA